MHQRPLHLPLFFLLLFSTDLLSQAAPTTSPFADKPCDSYSNYKDENGQPSVLLWGNAPLTDFGSRQVTFDQTGVRSLRQVPAPGIHPRIYFGPDDLPDVRRRLKETRCGQEAWKNIISWTEMMKGNYDDKAEYAQPDVWKGGFGGVHGRVPLFRLGIPKGANFSYNHNPQAAAFYQNLINGDATGVPPVYWDTMALEAFRCLVENDQAGAINLGKATITLLKADQAIRAADPKQQGTPSQPVGRFELANIYDFIFNWLTPEQKQAMHDELAAGTWSHDNYGTFNTAESSRSNWATFSYWLYQVLAIEDEPGYNELKVRGMYRGWRNLLTYGWYPSGATYEGEAKNQIGMDGVLLFAIRSQRYGLENLCGHPYLQAYARNFLPKCINPMQTGFIKYDLLGGSRAVSSGFTPCDMLGLRYMFPDDKIISWAYRKLVGENYENMPTRPDGYYFNGVLFYAVYASDFDPEAKDPAQLGLSNTFFCGERSLMMTRSSWNTDAMMLNMHTRAANGGHPFADRNAIMVAGAGRIWSPNGYASFANQENSVVNIDGKGQDVHAPARMLDFQDNPQATFVLGDAKYAWDWTPITLNKKRGYYTEDDVQKGNVVIPPGAEPEKHTGNDFAYTKHDYAYLNRPFFESPHWILPNGALSPVVRQENFPVLRAFRTAGLVRGPQPYGLVVDDIQKDDQVHHYVWTLALEPDLQIAKLEKKSDGETDIFLTGSDPNQIQPQPKTPLPSNLDPATAIPAGQPMLLVRVLQSAPSTTADTPDSLPQIVELPNMTQPKKYTTVRRLIISNDSITPDFKVLLYPYHQGAPLPVTAWNPGHTAVQVTWSNQADTIAFSPSPGGKTNVAITRDGANLIDFNKPLTPWQE